jgi:chromosome segregation ATPase
MSLEKDVKELAEKVEAMTGCGEVLKEAYSRVSELEAKVMQLEATMKDKEEEMARMSDQASALNEAVAEKDKLLEEYKKKMEYDVAQLDEVKANELKELTSAHEEALKTRECDLETLKSELAAANEAIEAYKAKEAELARQAKIVSRVSELVESGVAHDVAEATVNKFEDLDDEAFATIKSLVSSNVPEWAQTKSAEVASEEVAEAEEVADSTETEEQEGELEDSVAEEVLETAEAEESVDLSVGSDEDSEIDHTRASLVDFVYSRLGKQQSNKGE